MTSTTVPVTDLRPEYAEPGPDRRRGPRRYLRVVLVAILAGLAVVFVAKVVFGAVAPHLYAGTVLQQSTPAPPMHSLRYATGEAVDLGRFDGEVVLVYFGYLGCPDVCPTTLSGVAHAFDGLSTTQRERVHLLMVTIDPERDDPDGLEEYVEFFHPSFDGVAGSLPDIRRVATQYGVFFEHGEPSAAGEYSVDHTATLMAIGTDGALRVVWPPTVTPEEITGDLRELLAR